MKVVSTCLCVHVCWRLKTMNAKSTARKKRAGDISQSHPNLSNRATRRPPQFAKSVNCVYSAWKLECLVRLEFAIYPFRSIDFCVCAGRSMCSGLCYPHSTAPMVAMMFFFSRSPVLASSASSVPLRVVSVWRTRTHTATQILTQSRILENYRALAVQQPKCSTIRWKSA